VAAVDDQRIASAAIRDQACSVNPSVVLAALAANVASYVLAAAVAFGVFAGHGITTGVRDVVQETLPNCDAATKLRAGDVLVAVDHEPIRSGSFSDRVTRKNGAAVTLTIERAGVTSDVSAWSRCFASPNWTSSWKWDCAGCASRCLRCS
jgi:membrane-associated protease RseP (regulator of RpoE activity)